MEPDGDCPLLGVGRATRTCPSDINCDGGIDGADIGAFFVLWERRSNRADLNGDGSVDGADVEAFFIAWEGGC